MTAVPVLSAACLPIVAALLVNGGVSNSYFLPPILVGRGCDNCGGGVRNLQLQLWADMVPFLWTQVLNHIRRCLRARVGEEAQTVEPPALPRACRQLRLGLPRRLGDSSGADIFTDIEPCLITRSSTRHLNCSAPLHLFVILAIPSAGTSVAALWARHLGFQQRLRGATVQAVSAQGRVSDH
jgi:hypothetical protein